ncbi:MAG TPA: carboxypeptidase CpsA [Nitrososphaerales archaeon]|nr:carboxypeptidase CpsA [Nitrososphaerales archaeon]
MRDLASTILQDAKEIEDEIIKLRRHFHSNPELSYSEFQTSKLVAEKLRQLGIEVKTGVGGTGVVGLLRGKDGGKVVALRADMDALPVKEESDVPFRSKKEGVMHACGHDTHIAMLLGAAMILAKRKKEGLLSGSVKFLFQPAEENGGRGGALPMIEDGAMEDPKVDYVFGLHIGNPYPSGSFALREGAIMAAPDGFKIQVKGRGGHGSEPHNTVDPIYVSAQVINAIQGISSRMIKQTKPFVVSVCSIHSGTTDNVIPDDAFLQGTIRTLDEETRKKAKKLLKQVTESVCKTFGASCNVEFTPNAYPVTINDPKVTRRVSEILRSLKGTKVIETDVILGGEDFSRFLQRAPGTFYFLGTINKKKGCIYPNHSSKFKVDEDVLKYGAASLALLALEFSAGKQ